MNKLTPLAMLIILLAAPFASAELITVGTALDVELLYYQPVPAQPGDQVDIWIQVSNDGGAPSKTSTLTIIDNGPFIIETESQRVREIPSIPGQETFLVKTTARISKDANEGENTFSVRLQEAGSTSSIERDLTITVTAPDSSLSILEAKTNPEEIAPGETGQLTIRVGNVGTSLVRNVDVTLDLSDLSLAPLGSSDSKTIEKLAGGKEYTFTFDLISYPDAVAKAYKLPLTLSYEDEIGTEKTQEETVGVIIGANPELLVYFDQMGVNKDSKSGDVVIRFVNKGLSEIKLLEVEVMENDDVEVTSESSILYVGNIDEDDYESTEFSLKVSGDTTLPLQVRYKDALNREYTENFNLPIVMTGGNGKGGFGISGWLIILVILGVGFWWWRKRKAKKNKKR